MIPITGTPSAAEPVALIAHPGARDVAGLARSLVQLTKPGVTRMVVATTCCGAAIAPGPITDYAKVGWAIVGTTLIVASANALNMFLEGDVDALMTRTRTRPIPSGRLEPEIALWFGVALAFIGLPILDTLVNPVTAFIGGFALLAYVLAYTPMKRVSPVAVWVGAVPGAAPPLMGWTAVTGAPSWGALSLFLLLFIWQIPHFHAIAIFRTEEYVRAGLKVLPGERGLAYTKRAIAALLVLQLAVSALPVVFGLGGPIYITVAVLAGGAYFGWGLAGFREGAGVRWARSLFFASLPYLLLLYGALVIEAR